MIKICITVGLICIGFFHVEGQELRWVNSCKHADDAETKGVVMDHSGNIYSTGYFQDTLVVGPDTIVSHGNNDIFLFAHDSLGNELWHTTFGGKLNDQANAIAIDPAGNIWITGGVNDSIFVEDTLFTTGTTSQTLFFARYSKSGQYISMNLIPGAIYSQAQDIEIDSDFSAILTGQFYGTISKDNVTLSNPTGKTFYILKVDVTGTILWGRMCTGNANNGSDISIGPDAYYVTGSYNDGAQFGIQVLHAYGNNHNLFVAKYSKAGSLQWIQTQTGPAEVHGLKVSTNNNDRILVAGEFASKIDDLEYESKGSLDMVLLCYDPNGGLQWSKPIGGINADKTNGIATDGEDFYLTGMFSDSVLFSDTTIVAGGINATFIMKLDQFGNRHWFRQLAGTATVEATSICYNNKKLGLGGLFYQNLFATNGEVPYDTLYSEVNKKFFTALFLDSTNINTGIPNKWDTNDTYAFPNPNMNGIIYIVSGTPIKKGTIYLRDLTGREMQPVHYERISSSTYRLDLAPGMANGTYLINFIDLKGYQANTRIVLQRQ